MPRRKVAKASATSTANEAVVTPSPTNQPIADPSTNQSADVPTNSQLDKPINVKVDLKKDPSKPTPLYQLRFPKTVNSLWPISKNYKEMTLEEYQQKEEDKFMKVNDISEKYRQQIFLLMYDHPLLWAAKRVRVTELQWQTFAVQLYWRIGFAIKYEDIRKLWRNAKDCLRNRLHESIKKGESECETEERLEKWDMYPYVRFYRVVLREYEEETRKKFQGKNYDEEVTEDDKAYEDEIIVERVIIGQNPIGGPVESKPDISGRSPHQIPSSSECSPTTPPPPAHSPPFPPHVERKPVLDSGISPEKKPRIHEEPILRVDSEVPAHVREEEEYRHAHPEHQGPMHGPPRPQYNPQDHVIVNPVQAEATKKAVHFAVVLALNQNPQAMRLFTNAFSTLTGSISGNGGHLLGGLSGFIRQCAEKQREVERENGEHEE